MRADDKSFSISFALQQNTAQFLDSRVIQTAERFIEQQQSRIARQGGGKGEFTFLSVRKSVHRLMQLPGQGQIVGKPQGPGLLFFRRQTQYKIFFRRGAQNLQIRILHEQSASAGRRPPLFGGRANKVLTKDVQLSGFARKNTGKQTEKAGFAAAVHPGQTQTFAACQLEIKTKERRQRFAPLMAEQRAADSYGRKRCRRRIY